MWFRSRFVSTVLLVVGVMAAVVTREAAGQPLGAFYWQLAPFCNVLALHIAQHVTPSGAVYALTGFDDQCGATERGTVVGTATFNHDGTIGVGLTIVIAPGGTPVYVHARVALTSLSGPWVDSGGNTGTFVPLPSSGGDALRTRTPGLASGSQRPVTLNGIAPGSITTAQLVPGAIGATEIVPGAVGAWQIDPLQVQARINEDCPGESYLRGINADGTVVCEQQSTLLKAAHTAAPGLDLPDADALVHSVTLNVPTAGIVLVQASGNFVLFRRSGSVPQAIVRARCSISLGTSVDAGYEADVVLTVSEPDVRKRVRFALTRGFDVASGTFKANLVCRHFLEGSAEVDNPSLTALFVPSQ